MPREPAWSVEKFFQQSTETQIDAATLRLLAKRAQLTIAPEKEESLCREVGQILGCVHIIQEVLSPAMLACGPSEFGDTQRRGISQAHC
jgi:hypothetical protein